MQLLSKVQVKLDETILKFEMMAYENALLYGMVFAVFAHCPCLLTALPMLGPIHQDDTVRTKEGLDDAAGVAVVFDEDDEDEVGSIDTSTTPCLFEINQGAVMERRGTF